MDPIALLTLATAVSELAPLVDLKGVEAGLRAAR
jgi:hypothetical protein